jgi:sugar transferase (PEP-CTERM/EpsH1 system associated)
MTETATHRDGWTRAQSPSAVSVSAAATRPVRVMHVLHCLGTDGRTGGMEYGVIKLVNAADRTRVQSAVCSTRTADPALVKLLDPEVPYYECGARRGNDPWLVVSLCRLFRRFRPDIVHTHAWGTLLEGMLAAQLARVPVIVHGEHGTLQSKPYQLRIQRFAWGRADRVVSVSSRLAERLARDVGFDAQRIHTIRNGVNLERFGPALRPDGRRALGLAEDAIAIGIVGRLVDVKDHATLLRAFARVADRDSRTVLVIAGDGPLGTPLREQAAALGIAPRVRFLGHRDDVERVLAALDVFVLSSSSEGMSNTILEAMASGVAVVATHVGGADELVVDGETGLLVPAGDPDMLASALLRLAGDPRLRRDMAGAGMRRAHEEFGLPRMVAGYQALYDSLMPSRERA